MPPVKGRDSRKFLLSGVKNCIQKRGIITMKRKFTTFIVITLICCFCSGTIVNAKEVQSKEAVFGIVNMQRGGGKLLFGSGK